MQCTFPPKINPDVPRLSLSIMMFGGQTEKPAATRKASDPSVDFFDPAVDRFARNR